MKIAIIGASGHFANAFPIFDDPAHELVAVAPGSKGEDIGPLLKGCADRKLTPNYYADYLTLLETEDIDLAVINPWYCDHAAVSMACLTNGVHAYSEKPLATELDALDQLEKCYRGSNRALGSMLDLRCSPWFLAVDEALKSDAIGVVRMLKGRKSYKLGTRGPLYHTRAAYGGMIPWVGIHALDWILHFGGKPRRVTALQNADYNRDHGELEMTATVMLESDGGVLSTMTADYLRPAGAARHDDDRLLITGTKGVLEVIDEQVFLTDDAPRRALPLPPARVPIVQFVQAIGTLAQAQYAEDALLVTRVSLLAQQAGDEGRWIEIK